MPVEGVSPAGDLQQRVARLERQLAAARAELTEARQQQTATGEIADVIGSFWSIGAAIVFR